MKNKYFKQNWREAYSDLDFYEKSIFQFLFIIVCFAIILTPIRWFDREFGLVIINTTLVGFMLLVNALFLRKHNKAAKVVFVVSCVSIMLATVYIHGEKQLYWLYPLVAMLFFTMPAKIAFVVSSVLMGVIALMLLGDGVPISQLLQLIASVQYIVVVVFIFCSCVETQFKKLGQEALTDPLTGLGNRRSFDRFISTVEKRDNKSTSTMYLALIDIDNFKQINDNHGHQIGDLILKHLSEMIQANSRLSDLAYRVGGEEFACVLRASDIKHAEGSLERLRADVSSSGFSDEAKGISIKYTISIGIAAFDQDSHEWFESADEALYRAKHDGKNRIECIGAVLV